MDPATTASELNGAVQGKKPPPFFLGILIGTYRALTYWGRLLCQGLLSLLQSIATPEGLVLITAFLITDMSLNAGTWAREAYQDLLGQSGTKWWFICTDYITGLCAAAGLVVALLLYLSLWRTDLKTKSALLWFPLLWQGQRAWTALVIWLSCSDIMNPDLATTTWKSSTEYQHDPWIVVGEFIPMVLVICIIVVSGRKKRDRKLADDFGCDSQVNHQPGWKNPCGYILFLIGFSLIIGGKFGSGWLHNELGLTICMVVTAITFIVGLRWIRGEPAIT